MDSSVFKTDGGQPSLSPEGSTPLHSRQSNELVLVVDRSWPNRIPPNAVEQGVQIIAIEKIAPLDSTLIVSDSCLVLLTVLDFSM